MMVMIAEKDTASIFLEQDDGYSCRDMERRAAQTRNRERTYVSLWPDLVPESTGSLWTGQLMTWVPEENGERNIYLFLGNDKERKGEPLSYSVEKEQR